jgi:peptide chain release factor 1
MLEKLHEVDERYRELTALIVDPKVISDRDTYRKYTKEHAELGPIVEAYREWKKVSSQLEENLAIINESSDAELREMAQAELDELKESKERLSQELMLLLLPKDPNDDKNIILEIRAGTGGDESALFAGELFSAYTRYAQSRGYSVELLSTSHSDVGGFKEVIAQINGTGAYSRFKYESGVHRVQRVPATETQGRVHTSTVTVAVLPEAEEVDVDISEKDLRIDVFRSSGPGGQSVNTTDSAVRITHIPSGLVVSCQDEKSQHKNKAKALTVLRSRLLAIKQAEADQARSADRRSQIGSGERSEKIRTYNFPQSRVTDHRIGLTLYQVDSVMKGDLDLLIDPLNTHYRAEALKNEQGE